MTSVLILGASGLLGSSLSPHLISNDFKVLRQSRSPGLDIQLDLASNNDWCSCLKKYKPDVVINIAAATDVDHCEQNPQYAFDANVRPLLAFKDALSCEDKKPYLIHISTDQVYDGRGPHSECSPRPCNVYGLSKLASEMSITACPTAILRTSFFGSSHAPNRQSFSDWITHSLRKNINIKAFHDVSFSAIHMNTLCKIISRAIDLRPIGTFNVGTADGISKANFILTLAHKLGLQTETIEVSSIANHSLRARRPLDMRMNCILFEKTFGIKAPMMSEQIQQTANDYCF